MGQDQDSTTPGTDPNREPVSLTLTLPWRLAQDYLTLVEYGVYMSVEEALRLAIVSSWRHERGSYHTLRVDTLKDGSDEDSLGVDRNLDAPKVDPV